MKRNLSQQIELELRAAVNRGGQPPFRLTLLALAEHYEVSIQPVRIAVDQLLKEQWLLRNTQGRLIMNPDKKGALAGASPSAKARAKPDIGARLEEIIIQRSLKGEDVFLREEETAEQMGVGRTIVRAELTRMHGRGLVEHVPRRGWRVGGYSESRMLEYLEIRETLELKALELAQEHLEDKVLERLLKRNSPDAKGKPRIDDSLHAYLIKRSGNRFIMGFFDQHGAYHAALLNYASLAGSFLAEMSEQHRDILQALLDRDFAKARRNLRRHIRSQRPNVAHLLKLAGVEAKA
ncbi:GntR family transcriptional regulator [Pontiella desulfatans]|nr:GntR family transcriptional regulator [Pontiella desulfatans]